VLLEQKHELMLPLPLVDAHRGHREGDAHEVTATAPSMHPSPFSLRHRHLLQLLTLHPYLSGTQIRTEVTTMASTDDACDTDVTTQGDDAVFERRQDVHALHDHSASPPTPSHATARRR
jgi:hypothetical protein